LHLVPQIPQATDATFSSPAGSFILRFFWLWCVPRCAGSPAASTTAHGSDESIRLRLFTERLALENSRITMTDHNSTPVASLTRDHTISSHRVHLPTFVVDRVGQFVVPGSQRHHFAITNCPWHLLLSRYDRGSH
jgi:hypothetical protein